MNENTQFILTTEQTKKIPVSSFMRMWSLGSSQARIAARYFAYAAQKQFVSKDRKKELQNHFHLKSALQLLGTMGYLRGAIMKMGQLLANMPQLLPHELVEVFESLQFEAPPMHYSLIREVFLDELGKEPEEIFSRFDKRAFAAASLGQVHRARLRNGKEVAVKIQYPSIAETINADMKALSLLLQSMRFKKDFQYLHAHVQDARNVFLKEVDYRSEASFMEKNRKLFIGTQIVVPVHYPELCTRRILTMEYLPGKHVHNFLAQKPGIAKRNHFGELISYSLVHSWFSLRTVYADLHPGNYVLMDDGRLGFIDFGCYRQFDEERWKLQIDGETAMFQDDQEKLMHFLTKLAMHSHPEALDPEWVDLFLRQMKWIIAPITARGPFDFAGKEYVEHGAKLLRESFRKGYTRLDPFYNWSNRTLLGHRALMYRLKCSFDYSSLYLGEMQKYS
ncbi:MAG: AarF/ABC1/UbiB kinase family protein [Desulfobulbaceae bacterium]|nr:AarF/ABC1/UbiB kinase family protein [Desulfobulbaceae bacterium]